MCNATAYRAGVAGLKKIDKDAVLGIAPLAASAEYARRNDPADTKFQDYSTAYEQELRRAALREVQLDLKHLKTQPTEAELNKMVEEYSAFPDVKKQAFSKVFPEGITEKSQRLAERVFEDAGPIPRGWDNKHDIFRNGASKQREIARTHRAAMRSSPGALAALPPEMQGMEGEGGSGGGQWQYALSTAAVRTMVRDRIEYDTKGGEATTKVIESYMTRKDVQRDAYRSAYDSTNRGPAKATDKAPSALTAIVFADTQDVGAGDSYKAPRATSAGPAQDQPGGTGTEPTPGTPEFEQEKQRRLAYWKQKAADQLRIAPTDKKATK